MATQAITPPTVQRTEVLTQPAVQQISDTIQYANVFIPLAISIAIGVAAFLIFKEKVKGLCEDVKAIKTELKEIRDKTIACETSLKEREPLLKRESPISLTDRGRDLLRESGGAKFIEENFEELIKAVEKSAPETAYDVQELSKSVLMELAEKGNDRFIPLKKYLYAEGEELSRLISVMGVDLRDRILIKKEWNIEDVDKHDPHNAKN